MPYKVNRLYAFLLVLLLVTDCSPAMQYDLLIINVSVYDGKGNAPFVADIGINADPIAAIGDLSGRAASDTIDATGLAIAPG